MFRTFPDSTDYCKKVLHLPRFFLSHKMDRYQIWVCRPDLSNTRIMFQLEPEYLAFRLQCRINAISRAPINTFIFICMISRLKACPVGLLIVEYWSSSDPGIHAQKSFCKIEKKGILHRIELLSFSKNENTIITPD